MNFLRFGDPSRYSLHTFGQAVVIHCNPCARLTPGGEAFIAGPHWATVAELGEALAWMQWHELASHPTAAPDPHEGVPHHHHHYDGPVCPTPGDGPDTALYGLLLGHGRDATLWAYNDQHAANIIGRRLGGVVLALPILADYRVYDTPDNPVAALDQQRRMFGPCPRSHPTRGDCLGFAGHKPNTHMNERGVEWDDDVERAAGIIGQALSGALGVPVTVVDEQTGTETEYGPHSPVQPAESPFVCNCEPPAHARGISRCKGEPLDEHQAAEDAADEAAHKAAAAAYLAGKSPAEVNAAAAHASGEAYAETDR